MNITTDYIHGDRFLEISDYHWTDNKRDSIKSNGIIFCHTHNLNELFDHIRNSNNRYVLISHNSDNNITKDLYDKKPSCIIKWYGQNRIYDCDVIPLPLGIERPFWKNCGDMNYFNEIKNTERKIVNKYLMVMNINNGAGERKECIDFYRDKPNVTYLSQKIPFKEYVKLLWQHQYVISPPGNGYDCHRTWEALYIGVIPIVKKMHYFSELPLASVDQWKLEPFLIGSCIEKLDINYWFNRFRDDKKLL